MKFTNKHSIPPTLVRLLTKERYEGAGDISVTTLIGPPQINVLRKKHEEDLEVDVSNLIYSVMGTAIHSLLEECEDENDLAEERLVIPITTPLGTLELSGKPDLLDSKGNLRDYKVTSGWTVRHGEAKEEWEAQLNIYKWMLEQSGHKVKRLVIEAIIRDWSPSNALRIDGFPKCAHQSCYIRMWSKDKVENYIQNRMMLHQQALAGENIECTPEERWAKPSQYAVMKKGRKSALKLFDEFSVVEAHSMAMSLGAGHSVDFRPGENIRCEKYCDCKNFCPQYATIKGNE